MRYTSGVFTVHNKKIQLIAEVKTKSPFGYVATESWDELFRVAEKVGDMISIHTDARWGGSFELIIKGSGTFDSMPVFEIKGT